MATETRLYVVASTDGAEENLVRAKARIAAERFVTRQRYRGRVATQSDLERLLTAGAKVVDATRGNGAASDDDGPDA